MSNIKEFYNLNEVNSIFIKFSSSTKRDDNFGFTKQEENLKKTIKDNITYFERNIRSIIEENKTFEKQLKKLLENMNWKM